LNSIEMQLVEGMSEAKKGSLYHLTSPGTGMRILIVDKVFVIS